MEETVGTSKVLTIAPSYNKEAYFGLPFYHACMRCKQKTLALPKFVPLIFDN